MTHNIALDFPFPEDRTEAATAGSAKVSLLARLATYLDGRRRTDSEVGRYIQENGGAMTDEIEREISRRFGRAAGF